MHRTGLKGGQGGRNSTVKVMGCLLGGDNMVVERQIIHFSSPTSQIRTGGLGAQEFIVCRPVIIVGGLECARLDQRTISVNLLMIILILLINHL